MTTPTQIFIIKNMYVLWTNNKGMIIRGNWIISLINKAHSLGLSAYVEKLEQGKITKIYKITNGKVKGYEK